MPILNDYTRKNELALAVEHHLNHGRDGDRKIVKGVYLLSRWMDDYHDICELAECRRTMAGDTQPFLKCVEEGWVPAFARVEGTTVVPIYGVMEVLAASRLLADPDVLGGSGRNAGFVVERDAASGKPLAVRVVKIDAGAAFSFGAEYNQFAQSLTMLPVGNALEDKKDLQFGNMQPKTIRWASLSPTQQQDFARALRGGLDLLGDADFVRFLICRGGLFDQAATTYGQGDNQQGGGGGDHQQGGAQQGAQGAQGAGKRGRVVLTPAVVAPFENVWKRYRELQAMEVVYGTVLAGVDAVPRPVPFDSKKFGAARLRPEDAVLAAASAAAAQ